MKDCIKGCGRPVTGPASQFCQECRSKARRKPLKHQPTPEIDAIITEAYRTGYGTGAVEFISHKTGWPRWTIVRRALCLGIIHRQKKEPCWTAAEVDVLREFAWMGEERLRLKLAKVSGITRTRTAIHLKKKRLKLGVESAGGYTGGALAQLLGVDPKAVTRRWIGLGWLKAQRRGTDRVATQGGDSWWIEQRAAYRFVIEHPEEVDLGRVDKFWFLNLITVGKIPIDPVKRAA